MRLFNDSDDIYSGELIHHEGDNTTQCPVCGKTYKRLASAIAHFDKRTCHSVTQIFKGRPPEQLFYKLYQRFISLERNIGMYNFTRFKKSQMYTSIAKFYVHCYQHNIQHIEDYFDYLINEYRYKPLNTVLYMGKKESVLREYRKIAHEYLDDDGNERFFNSNKKKLLDDTSFTIRSIERGDISTDYLFTRIDEDVFISKLSSPELYRLTKFLELISV